MLVSSPVLLFRQRNTRTARQTCRLAVATGTFGRTILRAQWPAHVKQNPTTVVVVAYISRASQLSEQVPVAVESGLWSGLSVSVCIWQCQGMQPAGNLQGRLAGRAPRFRRIANIPWLSILQALASQPVQAMNMR